jgi:hypothetical protein
MARDVLTPHGTVVAAAVGFIAALGAGFFSAIRLPRGTVRAERRKFELGLTMWWLSFLHGGVVIIEGSSLTHARMLAAQRELGRVSGFAHGHFIGSERRALIPHDFVGRMLSPSEAERLREYVRISSRETAGSPPWRRA